MDTILVDLDGTLIPLSAWRPVFTEISKKIAEKAKLDPVDVWKAARAKSLELIRAFDHRGFDWQYVFQLVASELDAGDAPDVLETLQRHLPTFTTNEGAYEMLDKIKKMGYRVEIATNGLSTYQLPVIKALSLDKFIDGVRTSDMYNCPKTCPQFFHDAEIAIGDNPIFDTYFPKKFGLYSIFYGDWEKEVAKQKQRLGIDPADTRPDAVISTLREAPAAIHTVAKKKASP